LTCLGLAYMFFGEICSKKEQVAWNLSAAEGHIIAAKDYIYNNYQYHITVEDIAENVGVTTNYLANIFAKFVKYSPKSFLTEVKMKNAAVFLKTGAFKIGEVGKKVGYANQLHFSSEFKKFYGTSPMHYLKGEKKS
jgi:YesN/AraC family two-component response regulator